MGSLDLLLTLGIDLAKITSSLLDNKKAVSREEKEKAAGITEQYTELKRDYSDMRSLLKRYYTAIDTAMSTFGDYNQLNRVCGQGYRHDITGLINSLLDNSYHSRTMSSFQILTLTVTNINTVNKSEQSTHWSADVLVLENWKLFKIDRTKEVCELITRYDFQHHGSGWLVCGCRYFTEVEMNLPVKKFLPPL